MRACPATPRQKNRYVAEAERGCTELAPVHRGWHRAVLQDTKTPPAQTRHHGAWMSWRAFRLRDKCC